MLLETRKFLDREKFLICLVFFEMAQIPFHPGEAFIALVYIFLPFILGSIHAFIKGDKPDLFLNYYLFISVGIQGLVTGYVQMVRPDVVVAHVGWPNSPFILELGMANAAFGILGILSIWRDRGWRAATATGYGLFLLLTGIGHLVDILQHGFNPGNAGFFLLSDLLVPFILFLVL